NKKLNEINENIEEINNKEEDNLTNQAKLNKQLHQLEINLAESEERLKYQKERHTSIENEYQSLIEKEKELKIKINELDEKIKENEMNKNKKKKKTSKKKEQKIKEKTRIKKKLTFE